MWDIVWTDPDKELVGEHRAKKSRARGDKETSSSIRSGGNSSATSASSNSSSERPFRLFRSRAAKNDAKPRSKDRNRSPSFSGLATPSLTSTLSPLSQTFDSSSRRSSGLVTTAPTSPNKDGPEIFSSGSECDTFPSFDECLPQSFSSIKSKSAHMPNRFSEGDGHGPPNIAALIQMLGNLPSKTEADYPETPRSVPQEAENLKKFKDKFTGPTLACNLLVTPPKSPARDFGAVFISNAPDISESPVILTPPPKSPLRPAATTLGINNTAAWRTPSQWRDRDKRAANRTLKRTSHMFTEEHEATRAAISVSNNTKSVRCAAGAPTAMILARLKQVLNAKPDQNQGLEPKSSKQHWMLSLLHGMGHIKDPRRLENKKSVDPVPSTGLVMLLYETQVYAEYLGTLHSDTQLYHLTKESLTGNWPHNIQPLKAPPLEASCFPVAPRLFQTVYSFSLPSQCSYKALPAVLDSVYKCLKVGGSFKVTIIDPLPHAETLGPRLRAWMEKHLFPNLEDHSRCLEPSRLLPKLLGDANLRGLQSRRTVVKCFALPENAHSDDYRDPDPSIHRLHLELQDKAELRSIVGRLFWLEVWGQYVTPPDTWWWDDPECASECLQLGTFWEYQIIDAFKGEKKLSKGNL